jgi:hypothetical protein
MGPDGGVGLFGRGGFDGGLDEASEWVRTWADHIGERAASAQRMAHDVAAITATVRDSSGDITVTVDSTGMLTRLDLADRVRNRTGAELAADIMATVRQAQADLTAKISAVVAATVGTDSVTGATVIGSFERRFGPEGDSRG